MGSPHQLNGRPDLPRAAALSDAGERDLIAAVLTPTATGWTPPDVLAAAAAMGVDPLHYCSSRLRIPETVVLERAAGWAGLRFHFLVPPLAPANWCSCGSVSGSARSWRRSS